MEDRKESQEEIAKRLYKEFETINLDIHKGKNLEIHKNTLTVRIQECNDRITRDESSGKDAAGFKSMKNEYYALLYEIGERT